MSNVTIRDIAQRVGKSITTVSRALHDYDDVSPATKALVRQVAAEMGYTPDSTARRLQKQRTDTLGLVLPTFGPRFSDPFFSEFIAGVGNQAAELGFDLMVATRSPGAGEMETYHTFTQSRRVDGFIIVRTRQQDPRIAYLLQADYPFVAFGRTDIAAEYAWVDEDGAYGMGLIARHLITLGHRAIAFISAPQTYTFARHRLEGFRQALQESGLHMPAAYLQTGNLTEEGGYQAAKTLLALDSPPTAIAACNDLMALGAYRAAQERGLRVGADIAITGFDNIPIAEYVHPPLTTAQQPIYRIGKQVCAMLVSLIEGRPLDEERILYRPNLVVRGSTQQFE